MRNEFENVSRKLVSVSDCHGSLVSLSSKIDATGIKGGKIPPFNEPLFEALIKTKEMQHTAILTSSGANLDSVIELLLQRFKKPKDFFNFNAGDKSYCVVPKKDLAKVLAQLGIEKIDNLFDDEMPNYLSGIEIGQHIDPIDFLRESPSEEFQVALSQMTQRAP